MLTWISACSPLHALTPTPTATPVLSATPTMVTSALVEPSPTLAGCFEQRGQVETVAFDSVALPQFHIYLPACYDADVETHYPVLYLIHGAGFEDDQWIRLGVAETADNLSAEFIIVMPYDKYSTHTVDQDNFGDIFIDDLIPYIDENYRTLAEREHRAIGGLSRGGGWAIRYGLTRWELFSAIGGHSAVIFYRDGSKLEDWLAEIPRDSLPQIYLDAGDKDQALSIVFSFANLLAEIGIPHEWRLFSGFHDETYWSAHIEEYLRWYAEVLK